MTLKSSRLARLLLAASLLPVCALAADPTVRRIQVELDGPGAVADAYVLGHVAFREGQPFSREAAADTVRSLYATGRFSQAEVLPSLDAAAGQVDVRIRVQLRPLVESVSFTGLEDRVDEDDLLEDLAVKAGDPLDPVALNQGRNKALERLRKKRPFAGLEVRREETADGRIRLVAAVTLTPELRIDTVSIRGASQLDESDVLASAGIKSASWRWWKLSGLSGGGRLGADEYREDCERLVAYYRAQGFLDAELETTDAALACVVRQVEGDEGWIDVVFRLREGRRYAVGTVSIAGNNLGKAEGSPFSSQALLGLISNPSARAGLIAETTDRLASGGWYSGAAVDVAIEKIREAYGRRGHLDVQIGVTRSPNLETGAIDLKFEIREGQVSTVRQVIIEGNTKTRTSVVARELTLQPGDLFDLEAARRSESRLRNTRFFENVRVAPVATAVTEQRDLLVALKEGPTGMVSFGAGFSSVEQLVGFVEYSEGNFDAFNPEGWFRGGGQKFRLRVSAGNLSNSIEHSFEEPALWERDLAVGYNIYQRFSGFQSSYYDLQSRGFDVYARRNILGVQARLAAGVRSVELRDPNVSLLPDDILETAALGAISIPEVTLSLVRDTRDDFTFPTRGFRVALNNTYAGGGLGGDVDYLKTDLRLGRWFLISREATQTLALVARVGTYQDFEELPFFERQQLGGAYDLRGFKYNYVGSPEVFQAPAGSLSLYQPVGGLTYGFITAEYTIKASDTLRWALFTDWGFVNEKSNDFNPGQINGDAGLGLRILLGGAVLRLDFGFPLSTTQVGGVDVNDDGMQLHFSFGTSF
jgi:outer membrane protein insertion porin family